MERTVKDLVGHKYFIMGACWAIMCERGILSPKEDPWTFFDEVKDCDNCPFVDECPICIANE